MLIDPNSPQIETEVFIKFNTRVAYNGSKNTTNVSFEFLLVYDKDHNLISLFFKYINISFIIR